MAPLAALLLLGLAPALQDGPAAPGTIDTLYVVELTHADVGFNAPPTVMAQRNHDRTVAALDLADVLPAFHWTIETTYQLEGFLDRASAADVARLRARLAEGRFAYGANYTNLHSGLCGEEEMHRLPLYAAGVESFLGQPARAAFLNDVPGFTLAMPRVLATAGVPYAVLGPNGTFGGRPDIPIADRPFWWEGRDGSRVLTWITYGSYAEGFVEWGLLNMSTAANKIPARIQEFEAAGYPYDAVLVVRGFDDTIPSSGMTSLAAQWNATYTTPKIRLATASEFFDHLLAKYGDVFPSYRGDAAGLWEDVSLTTPASAARVRHARALLPDIEALWAQVAMLTGRPYPAAEFQEAWKLALVLDEHSNGGQGWPGLLTRPEIEQENREFVAVGRRCARLAADLRDQALSVAGPALVPSGEAGLVLFNPLGEAFDGIVEVDCGAPQPADLRLADPAGGPDAVFRWMAADRSALALRARIPARGWRRWRVTGGGSPPPPPAWIPGAGMALGGLQLSLDPADGTATALLEAVTGIDWLQQPGPHRFGGVEYERHLQVWYGLWQHRDPQPVTLEVEEPGPLMRRMRVLDKRGAVLREYRLVDGETRLDLGVFLRRSELPFVPFDEHSHHYAVALPAAVATPATVWIDGPDGWFRPGVESLPGAALGHFGTGTGAVLEGAQGRWFAVSSPDTAMVDLGEMNGGPLPAVETDENSLTWKLIRAADMSEVQGGAQVPIEAEPGVPDERPYWFRVRFGTGGAPPDRQILRRDLAPPLVAWVTSGRGGNAPAAGSLVAATGPAELVCLKRSAAGDGLVLRLRAGAAGGSVTIRLPYAPSSVWRADLVERPLTALAATGGVFTVPLRPNGVVTVLARD